MKKSLFALAFGTLALGIAEFAMMGILSNVAESLSVSVSAAGSLISAYAIGVCVGAPVLLFLRKMPLKNILLLLVSLIFIGNLCSSLSGNYWMLMLFRFVSGLPHGAYFGVAAIIAERLSEPGKSTQAVAIMVSGMTVANLFGVPLGTALSNAFSWKWAFVLVAVWSLFTFFAIVKWVPQIGRLPHTPFKKQFSFLKSWAPWLIIGATLIGNGGVFCWFSYVNPMLLNISGFSVGSLTWLMMLAGLGMVMGNLIGAWLADRFKPGLVTCLVQLTMALSLVAMFVFSPEPWLAVPLMMLCAGGLFAAGSPLQYMIIKFSKGGEMLGGASIQMAFNGGNALAAYLGGLVLIMGYDARYPALIGVPMALIGASLLFILHRRYEKVSD